MKYFFILTFLIILKLQVAQGSSAEESFQKNCKDLASLSCSPGNHADGTGEIKSEQEIQKMISAYIEESKADLENEFKALLDGSNPKNEKFRLLALKGMGLENSPTCLSEVKEEKSKCEKMLLDELVYLTQRNTLGPAYPSAKALYRDYDVEAIDRILNDAKCDKIINAFAIKTNQFLENSVMKKDLIKNKIYPQVQDLIVERLKKLPISEDIKKLMIIKVNGIEFDESGNCSKSDRKKDSEEITNKLQPNAFYDSTRDAFKICSGALIQGNSEFTFASIIAHELSHSIDPCGVSRKVGSKDSLISYSQNKDLRRMEDEYPIANLISCLRTDSSVGARNFVEKPLPPPKCGTPDSPCVVVLGSAPNLPMGGGMGVGGTGVKPQASYDFCSQDQIGESISDWMAAEVLPEYINKNFPNLSRENYINGYANASRPFCSIRKENPFPDDVHPIEKDRINKILISNPQVRKQMGCQSPPSSFYCDPNDLSSRALLPSSPPGGYMPPGAGRMAPAAPGVPRAAPAPQSQQPIKPTGGAQ